jgi:hypothetical protein
VKALLQNERVLAESEIGLMERIFERDLRHWEMLTRQQSEHL